MWLMMGLIVCAVDSITRPVGQNDENLLTLIMTLVPIFLGALGLAILRIATKRLAARELGISMVTGLGELIGVALVAVPVLWQVRDLPSNIVDPGSLGGIFGRSQGNPDGTIVTLASYGALLVVPLFLLAGSLASSVGKEQPFLPEALRRFRTSAAIAVCVLAFGYAGCVVETARYDRLTIAAIEQSVQGEGQYLARISGLPWPA